MNVASIELCTELYELSGWEYDERRWFFNETVNEWQCAPKGIPSTLEYQLPAYDLGYLIRKLPKRDSADITSTVLLGRATNNVGWSIVYQDEACLGGTPEDAAAKLAIKLFKQGVLKKEGQNAS